MRHCPQGQHSGSQTENPKAAIGGQGCPLPAARKTCHVAARAGTGPFVHQAELARPLCLAGKGRRTLHSFPGVRQV